MARTSPRSIELRQKENRAIELRSKGWSLAAIAAELGYASSSSVLDAIQRGLDRAPAETAPMHRALMDVKLDGYEKIAYDVLERFHYVVVTSGPKAGSIVYAPPEDGEAPLQDSAPVLAALDRLLRIQERRAKLHGTDAPSKRSVEVVTKDALVAEMERMSQEMADAEGAAR